MPALLTKVRPVVCLSRSITLALSPRPSRTSPLALYNAEKPMYGLLLARSSIVFCSSAGNARQHSPAIAWKNGRLERIRVRDQTMGVLSQALHRACSKRRTCSKRRACVVARAFRGCAAPRVPWPRRAVRRRMCASSQRRRARERAARFASALE